MVIKGVAFDFDGTLIDSYSCIPDVYNKLLDIFDLDERTKRLLIQTFILREDVYDWENVIEYKKRILMFKNTLLKAGILLDDDSLKGLFDRYWELRISFSKPRKEVKEVLMELKKLGLALAIISGKDEIIGLKKLRIKKSNLMRFFDRIYVVEEEINSKYDGIIKFARDISANPNEIVYVDDQPRCIIEAKRANAIAVQIKFDNLLKLSWSHDANPDYVASDLKDALAFIKSKL